MVQKIKPQTILLTGGTGFLGSVIVKLLVKNGFRVVILKRDKSDLSRLNDLLGNKFVIFFNLDKVDLSQIFKCHKINFIIHIATSYGRFGESVSNIKKVNVVLPLKLLKFSLKYKTPVFINTDTFLKLSKNINQKDYWYVAAKKEFLRLAKQLIKGKAIKFINMKIEHAYGPNDNPSKFVSFIIRELLKNNPCIPFNSGMQKRDFVFVDDVADAFLAVIKNIDKLNHFEEFGIGFGKNHIIKKLGELFKKNIRSKSVISWGDLPYKNGECMFSKAKTLNNKKIGWKPKYSLEQGVKKTVSFYKK